MRLWRLKYPERAKTPPDKAHDYHLRNKFGLTAEEYSLMLASQGGVCDSCNNLCTTGKRLAVDHCHASGKIRALLCLACNTALGIMREDAPRIRALAAYIERHTCDPSDSHSD